MTELNDTDKALLAREVAADGRANRSDYKFRCPKCAELFFDAVAVDTVRAAFTDGWDAALAWTKEQESAKTELVQSPIPD